MAARKLDWTDARVRRLKRLWNAGVKTEEIATILSGAFNQPVTKNMVIGKVRRLKLDMRTGGNGKSALLFPPVKSKPKAPQNQPRIRKRHQRKWKGISYPANAHPLVRMLVNEMNVQRCTWVMMHERSGVGLSVFSSWRTVHAPSLPSLEACFNVLGKTLMPVDMP